MIDQEDGETDPDKENTDDKRGDHTYFSTGKKQKVKKQKRKDKTSGIEKSKDLRKKEEIINKRYNAKIEENDGLFSCRACSKQFPSKIFARIHVNKSECLVKKKKKTNREIKCDFTGCERVFLLKKRQKKAQKTVPQ